MVTATSTDGPWLARQDWASGRIKGSSLGGFLALGIFALVWNGLCFGILFFAWKELLAKYQGGERAMLLVGLFPLAGILVAMAACYRLLVWLRFGTSVLELETIPGVIGGRLRGTIQTRVGSFGETPVELSLACVNVRTSTRTSGNSTSTSTVHSVLWEDGHDAGPDRLGRGARGIAIPVDIHVPHGLRESDDSDRSDRIVWRLSAAAAIPGVDYTATFEVPLYYTPESREETGEERAERVASVDAPEDLLADGWAPPVDVRPTGEGGVEFHFRPEFRVKDVVGSAVFTLVLLAAVPLSLALHLHPCVPVGTGLFGLLLLLAVSVMLFGRSHVAIAHGQIDVVQSFLGLKKRASFPCADVTSVGVARSLSDQQQGQKNQSWEIKLLRRDGTSADTGAMFRQRRLARWIAAEMEKVILAHAARGTGSET